MVWPETARFTLTGSNSPKHWCFENWPSITSHGTQLGPHLGPPAFWPFQQFSGFPPTLSGFDSALVHFSASSSNSACLNAPQGGVNQAVGQLRPGVLKRGPTTTIRTQCLETLGPHLDLPTTSVRWGRGPAQLRLLTGPAGDGDAHAGAEGKGARREGSGSSLTKLGKEKSPL